MDKFWDDVIENLGPVEGGYPDIDFSEVDLNPASAAFQTMPFGGDEATSLRDLTDEARATHAINPNQNAGTRVRFVTNIGSILTYADLPAKGLEGTVVTVKTGGGITTYMGDHLFVLWDDGKFRDIRAEHLRLARRSRRASNVRMVVADLGDLAGFFSPAVRVTAGGPDELVHMATKDLWAVRQESGKYVIERLFNETGLPLKV